MRLYKWDLKYRNSLLMKLFLLGIIFSMVLFTLNDPTLPKTLENYLIIIIFIGGGLTFFFEIGARLIGTWFVIPLITSNLVDETYFRLLKYQKEIKEGYKNNEDIIIDGHNVIFLNSNPKNKSFLLKKRFEEIDKISEDNLIEKFKYDGNYNWCHYLKEYKRFYYELDEVEMEKFINKENKKEKNRIKQNIKSNKKCDIKTF